MSAAPDMRGLLLCAAVAACGTLVESLLFLILLPVQLLLCLLFARLLRRCRLSERTAVWLFSAGSGIALLRLWAFTPYSLEIEPITLIALLLCGAAAPTLLASPPSAHILWRTFAAMLLIGGIRELLAEGTLFGLFVYTPPAVTVDPIGALLIAALIVWLFRLSVPVVSTAEVSPWNTIWLTLAVCSVKACAAAFLPMLSDTWILWLTVLTAALLTGLPPLRTAWAPLAPAVALFVSDGWWHALAAAAVTALVLGITYSLTERWRRVPLTRSFRGSPALLTIAAIAWSAVSSF